ncbi:hypothetical protein PMIN06_010226 [Paraphaeosphaeria minitans]
MVLDPSPNFGHSGSNSLDPIFAMKLSTLRLQRLNRLKAALQSSEHLCPSKEEEESLYDLLELLDWRKRNMDLTPLLEAVDEQIEINYYKTGAECCNEK